MDQYAIRNIEEYFLTKIGYNSNMPYTVFTYKDLNWTNKYSPPEYIVKPNEVHLIICNDFSSVLFNSIQYFLQDGEWYTAEEYEEL